MGGLLRERGARFRWRWGGLPQERGACFMYCFSSKKDLKIVSLGRGRESVDRPDSVVNDAS